ncbi:kinase, partial [Carboxydothermus islandicus]
MKVKAYVCGTAGELVQGSIGGKDFLLTAPVNLGNVVEVSVSEKLEIPEDRPKIKRLV